MYEVKVSESNLYAGGALRTYPDGTAELEAPARPAVVLGEGDRYYTVKNGDMLDKIAWAEWRDEVPDAERWWWVLAEVNDVENPFDLTEFTGREILIPNLQRYRTALETI